MSSKAVATGQFALVNESTGSNIYTFDLGDVFKAITGLLEQTFVERQISLADGPVALDLGGVATVKGFLLFVVGGTAPITFKHDSNTNGLTVNNGILLFGSFTAPIVSTTSTQAVTIKYVVIE